MKFLLTAVCLLRALATSSFAESPAPAFQFVKEIELGHREQEELVAVPLDSEVYAATQDNFADVRIVDSEGRAVPYLLRKAVETKPHVVRKSWLARDVSLKLLDNDAMEIRARLDKDDPTPNGLRLVTPLRNFEQRVRVFGINSPEDQPLVREAVVFDYSKFMDVRHPDVRLPPTSEREFRIVIDGVTSDQESQLIELTRKLQGDRKSDRSERAMIERRPFRIDRIEFWREETQTEAKADRRSEFELKIIATHQDVENKQTLVDLTSRRESLVAIRLRSSSRNFSRHVALQTPEKHGVKTDWQSIGEAVLSRIEFRDIQQEHLELRCAEHRRAEYRLVLDDRDSPPLQLEGVEGIGPIYQAVFLAAPSGTYRLQYGAKLSDPPSYDIAAMQTALSRGFEPLPATLGAQIESSDRRPQAITFRDVINNPILLSTLACALVAALAWGLYRAAHRIDQLPRDEPPAQ